MKTLPALVAFTVLLALSHAPTHAQEQWLPRTSGTTANLWGVAHGGSPTAQWVAVGEQGTILTSLDAVTWTPRASGFVSLWLVGVGYGNGLYVVVGDQGTILTSRDGSTWTVARTGGARINAVAYGNGFFLAIDESGGSWNSADGAAWSYRATARTVQLRGLTFATGMFVLTGANGTIQTTTNGVDFIPRATGTTAFLESVTFGNKLFVAVGAAGATYASPDGVNWTPQITAPADFYGVSYFNNRFAAVGTNGTITSSLDGRTWSTAATGNTQSLIAITASDRSGTAVGFGGTIHGNVFGNFQPDPRFIPEVSDGRSAGRFTALQPDGKILANGASVRYHADGSLDTTYALATDLGPVKSAKVALDGRIVIWTYPNSNEALSILRPDGSLETTISKNISQLSGLALQPDGKILITGGSLTFNGVRRNGVARLNRDGSLDPTFDPGTGPQAGQISDIATLSNGKILVCGFFSSFDGNPRRGLVRLNPEGTVDPTFVANPSGIVTRVLALPGGKTIAFESLPDRLVRYNADGSLDVVIGTEAGASTEIYALALQPDGHVIVGGGFTSFNGIPFLNLVRIKPDATLDLNFAAGATVRGDVLDLAVQVDGKILFTGNTSSFQNERLLRLNADGSPDTSFAAGQPRPPSFFVAARQADGRFVVSGDFSAVNGTVRPGLARLLADGTLDASFKPSAALIWQGLNYGSALDAASVAILPDNSVVVGGTFAAVGTSPRSGLARFSATGVFDARLNPAFNLGATVQTLAALPDGRIVVGGNFSSVNDVPRNHVAAFLGDGSLDPAFAALAATNGPVRFVVARAGGGVLLAGKFTTVAGQRRNHMAALTATGTLDPAFSPLQLTTTDEVFAIAPLPDGGAIIAIPDGTQTPPRTQLRRLTHSGDFDPTFRVRLNVNADFSALTVDTQGRTLAAYNGLELGEFGFSSSHFYFRRFTPGGEPDPSFDVGTGPNAPITTIISVPDGSLWVGGSFSSFDDLPSRPLIRLQPTATRTASLLLNISTRGETAQGAGVLTAGFVIGGSQPKTVLLRAIGPALAAFGVANTLVDPALSLIRADGVQITSNANWSGVNFIRPSASAFDVGYNLAQTGARVGAFPLTSPLEAALIATLAPGNYTAQVPTSGVAATAGITLLEVYDANVFPGDRRLLNISTRGTVGPADRTLIAGVVVSGTEPKAVLIRAIGPGLVAFGVNGVLADPTLSVVSSSGATVGANDDWGIVANKSSVALAAAKVGAFALADSSKDAALLLTLAPGTYTCLVSGVNNTTGTALVEVYEVP